MSVGPTVARHPGPSRAPRLGASDAVTVADTLQGITGFLMTVVMMYGCSVCQLMANTYYDD